MKHEIFQAIRKQAREGADVLIPLRLMGYETLRQCELFDGGKDVAADIREYFIPDFSRLDVRIYRLHHQVRRGPVLIGDERDFGPVLQVVPESVKRRAQCERSGGILPFTLRGYRREKLVAAATAAGITISQEHATPLPGAETK